MNGPAMSVVQAEDRSAAATAQRGGAPGRLRLGEELPVFCERCGYALHGLPPVRCEHCEVLYFRCPECGHSQPINTLRPAVQKILGRLRAWFVGLWVFVKLNMVFWVLFAWGAMGMEWSYHYVPSRQMVRTTMAGPGGSPRVVQQRQYTFEPRPMDWESMLAFGLFGLPTGMVLRMLLLRWRRGYVVGAVLAGLVVAAVICGAWLRQFDFGSRPPSPFTMDLGRVTGIAACCVVLGASVVFWIWSGLVRLFLPTRVAKVLLDWQQSGSDQVSDLARA